MRSIDRVLFEEYLPTQESLVLYRIAVALFFLTLVLPEYQWIGEFPDTFFAPPIGFTYFFFMGFPSDWVFQALNIILIGSSVCLLCGRNVMAASFALSGTMLVGNAWAYSFGKINHDILLVLIPMFLALAGWDGRSRPRGWPMALFAWCIALALFTAAWQKAASGWLDPDTQAVLAHLMANAGMSDRETVMSSLVIPRTPRTVWEAQDIATIMLEGVFVLAWPRRTAFQVACAFACFFHLGVALLMQITFSSNLLAYAAFVQWHAVMAMMPHGGAVAWRSLVGWLTARTGAQVLFAALVLSALYLSVGNPLHRVSQYLQLHPETMHPFHLILAVASAVIALVFLTRLIRAQQAGPQSTAIY